MAESFFNKKLVCVKEMMYTASNDGYSEPIVFVIFGVNQNAITSL